MKSKPTNKMWSRQTTKAKQITKTRKVSSKTKKMETMKKLKMRSFEDLMINELFKLPSFINYLISWQFAKY